MGKIGQKWKTCGQILNILNILKQLKDQSNESQVDENQSIAVYILTCHDPFSIQSDVAQ